MDTENQSRWIWTPEWTLEDDACPRLVCFRRTAVISRKPAEVRLRLSADTRYKFYINGVFVQDGPARGDRGVWYVDEADTAPFLRQGNNVFAVEVLRYPMEGTAGNHGMFRTERPGLYVECTILYADGSREELSADAAWRCHVNRAVAFYREEERFAPLVIHEHAGCEAASFRWKEPGFDDSGWCAARPYTRQGMPLSVSPGALSPRPIPLSCHRPRAFFSVRRLTGAADWETLLRNQESVTIPASSECSAVFDAGEETNAFLFLAFSGGQGAVVELLEAERYVPSDGTGLRNWNRLDWKHGVLQGYQDDYAVLGAGTPDAPEVYEPYFYRTFRFLRLRVKTGDKPLEILRISCEETGYPLEAGTEVETSDASLSRIWDISLRTLRLCMRETYMDCPFYERMQYLQDTRSQILYTYAVSADDRLARKAIDDFSRAQRPDGLLNASYPNMNPNVIPGFSIYYILMVHDHMMYFGDKMLVRRALPVIDRILQFFDAHLTPQGLVGQVGGVNGKAAFWSFIDWAAPWMETEGMPPAGLTGPVTMESLLYLLGLQKAAELSDCAGRHDTASEYRTRGEAVRRAVLRCCVNGDGMITDGPAIDSGIGNAENGGTSPASEREAYTGDGGNAVSQHGQVFGILTGVLSPEQGRRNLLETILNPDRYAQCTVAMCFYLFRALEQTELYAYTDRYWNIWRTMLQNGCTTCVEAENYARSECHAWGALALYELPTVALGIRPAAPGYGKIEIRPVPGYLDHASGTVRTPRGDIQVSWTKAAHGLDLTWSCEETLRPSIIISE